MHSTLIAENLFSKGVCIKEWGGLRKKCCVQQFGEADSCRKAQPTWQLHCRGALSPRQAGTGSCTAPSSTHPGCWALSTCTSPFLASELFSMLRGRERWCAGRWAGGQWVGSWAPGCGEEANCKTGISPGHPVRLHILLSALERARLHPCP